MQFLDSNSFNVRSTFFHLKHKVALVYGARHMVAIAKYFRRLDYKVIKTGWIKIFDLY